MKKFAILFAVVASFVVLTGCASKNAVDQSAAPAAPAHHDFKNEEANAK